MNAAPYDEKNKADFNEMTNRIEAALTEIKGAPDIPATEKELAKRAKCSRGSLRNRVWPLERLKEIKAERKLDPGAPIKVTKEHLKAVDAHIKEKEELKGKLKNSRDEAAVWFDKYCKSESAYKKLSRHSDVLQKTKASLEESVRTLKQEKARLEEALEIERAKHVVVPFLGIAQSQI